MIVKKIVKYSCHLFLNLRKQHLHILIVKILALKKLPPQYQETNLNNPNLEPCCAVYARRNKIYTNTTNLKQPQETFKKKMKCASIYITSNEHKQCGDEPTRHLLGAISGLLGSWRGGRGAAAAVLIRGLLFGSAHWRRRSEAIGSHRAIGDQMVFAFATVTSLRLRSHRAFCCYVVRELAAVVTSNKKINLFF